MLDVDFVEMKQGFLQYLPVGALVGVVLFIEMFLVGAAYFSGTPTTVVERDPNVSNLEAFGEVLYTEYAGMFEAAGLILLVALIGAVVLTLREREGVRKQNVTEQNARTRETGVVHIDIEPGQGIG